MSKDRTKEIKWIPFALLFIGILLKWLNIDTNAILLNIGFICYGVVSVIDGIKGGYYKQLNVDTFRVLVPLIILLLAIDNLRALDQNYTLIAIAFLLQIVVTQDKRL